MNLVKKDMMRFIDMYNKTVEPINYPAANLLAHFKRYIKVKI